MKSFLGNLYVRLLRGLRHRQRLRMIDALAEPGCSVLEIGAGNTPLRLSTILLDKYAASSEFHRSGSGEIAFRDRRPFILGDGNRLPFSDDAIDVVVCRHVIEHVDFPADFLSEIQRVGKKGYLETPSVFSELVSGGFGVQSRIRDGYSPRFSRMLSVLEHGPGSKGHKWYVVPIGNRVYFLPKTREIYPLYLVYGAYAKSLGRKYPAHRLPSVSYCTWTEKNPLASTILSESDTSHASESLEEKYDLQGQLEFLEGSRIETGLADAWGSIDAKDILRCPLCMEGSLERRTPARMRCRSCSSEYPVYGNVRVLLREVAAKGGETG
jgi:SAM-dependent methyltransferase